MRTKYTFSALRSALCGMLFLAFCLLPAVSWSDELSPQQIAAELQAVRARIETERARYQEAKAKMERSELVAKYLLPELKEREKKLEKKIRKRTHANDVQSETGE